MSNTCYNCAVFLTDFQMVHQKVLFCTKRYKDPPHLIFQITTYFLMHAFDVLVVLS